MPDPTRNQLIALAIITFGLVLLFAVAGAAEVLTHGGGH